MENQILLLSDFVGLGDVALASGRAILTHDGYRVFSLPTALISHTWNLGAPAVLDTTDYICQSLARWAEMGIRFDAVCIGYVPDAKQAEFLARQCRTWQEQGIPIFLDPVFADNGRLYSGISPTQVEILGRMLDAVTCIFPNATEAAFLAGAHPDIPSLLTALTPPMVFLTGARLENQPAVALKTPSGIFCLPYTPVPGTFSGTGDAFFACCVSALLRGLSPQEAAREAMTRISAMLRQAVASGWTHTGLPVERWL